jgi:hypothetical protein
LVVRRFVPPALLATLLVMGCNLDDLALGVPEQSARVRFMNASRGSPPLTLFLNDQPVAAGLAYGDVSGYLALKARLYSIRMGSAPDRHDASTGALVSGTFHPIAGVSYTLFAAGPGEAPQAMLSVDTGAVPAEGKAKVRAINAAPYAPPIDVHLVGSHRAPDASTRLLHPFTFGAGATYNMPGYVEREPGTYRLVVTLQGTTEPVLDVSPIDLAAGQARTMVVLDADGGGVVARVVADRN